MVKSSIIHVLEDLNPKKAGGQFNFYLLQKH